MNEDQRINEELTEEALDGVAGGFIQIEPSGYGPRVICPNCGATIEVGSLPTSKVCWHCGKESYFTK